MAKILKFPTKEEISDRKKDLDEDAYYEYCEVLTDIAISFSEYMYNILADELDDAEMGIDIDDPESKASEDAHVIINMLCSMILRHNGMVHHLQPSLDEVYNKIINVSDEHEEDL